jgi:hypothetical protein
MALVAAKFTSSLKPNLAWALLLFILIEGIANQQHDFFIKPQNEYKLKAEKLADKWIAKNEKVIINGGLSPQSIYFLNRKGWTLRNKKISNQSIDSLKQLGAKYLVLDKNKGRVPVENERFLFENKNYLLYHLD